MPNLLVVVHNQFEAKLLTAFFNKNVPEIHIVTLPPPPKGTDGNILEVLSNPILFNEQPFIPDVMIIESNYGKPSDVQANEALFKCILKEFPKALIVAYSSTMDSLKAALAIDNKITIMGKGNVKPAKCDNNRVHSLTSLKTLMNQEQDQDHDQDQVDPERSSIVTYAYDLTIALEDCELKVKKDSVLAYNSAPRPL